MNVLENRNLLGLILSKMPATNVRNAAPVSRAFREAAKSNIHRRVDGYRERFKSLEKKEANYGAAIDRLAAIERASAETIERLVAPLANRIPEYAELRERSEIPFYLDTFAALYVTSPELFDDAWRVAERAMADADARNARINARIGGFANAFLLSKRLWVTDETIASLVNVARLLDDAHAEFYPEDSNLARNVYRILEGRIAANGAVPNRRPGNNQILNQFVNQLDLQGTSQAYQYLLAYGLQDRQAFLSEVDILIGLMAEKRRSMSTMKARVKQAAMQVLASVGFHGYIEDANIVESMISIVMYMEELASIRNTNRHLRDAGALEKKRVHEVIKAMAEADLKTAEYMNAHESFAMNASENGMMPNIGNDPISELVVPRLIRRL